MQHLTPRILLVSIESNTDALTTAKLQSSSHKRDQINEDIPCVSIYPSGNTTVEHFIEAHKSLSQR